MTTNDTYLAIFLGSKTSPRMKAWLALPEVERRAKEQEGMAAWKAWVEKNRAAVSAMGGPLGKTKKITEHGIEDVSNEMGAFMVVRAESHEAAARLFGGRLQVRDHRTIPRVRRWARQWRGHHWDTHQAATTNQVRAMQRCVRYVASRKRDKKSSCDD